MTDQTEDQELTPTPEQLRGYQQRVRATLAMGQFDKFCATLTRQQLFNHAKHAHCVVIPQLANELVLVEIGDSIGIAAPRKHSGWMDMWPYEAIVATDKELFFVSRPYEWMQEDVPRIGISTGKLPYNELLNRLCKQEVVHVYETNDVRMIHSARMLCDGVPVKLLHSIDGIAITKTREHYDGIAKDAIDDGFSRVSKHFVS